MSGDLDPGEGVKGELWSRRRFGYAICSFKGLDSPAEGDRRAYTISTLLENWSVHLQRDQSTQYTVGCLVPSAMTSCARDYFASTSVCWQHRLAVLRPDQRVLSRSQDGGPDPGLTAFSIHVVEPVPDGCLRPVNFICAHKH